MILLSWVPCLLILTVLILDDWKGSHDWAALQKDLKTQGESLEENSLYAPQIPEENNFGAIPLFQLEPDPDHPGRLTPLKLKNAFKNSDFKPYVMSKDKTFDLETAKANISSEYDRIFHQSSTTKNPITELDAIYPFLLDLRTEAKKRTDCRFEEQDLDLLFFERIHDLIVAQIRITKPLTAHGFLALQQKESNLVLDDVRVSLLMMKGTRNAPDLVSGLVTIAILGINHQLMRKSFLDHAWNEQHLNEMDALYSQFDFLKHFQTTMRAEAIFMAIQMMEDLKKNPKIMHTFSLENSLENRQNPPTDFEYWLCRQFFKISYGWIEENKTNMVTAYFQAIKIMDATSHRADAKFTRSLNQQIGEAETYTTPWNIFFIASVPVIMEQAPKFAYAQSLVDQTLIACALERYWLHHQAYPEHLEDLTSAEAPQPLPHDVMTGEPYRYRLNADGTYLLYSVGWDQKDDQGKPVEIGKLSEGSGDWVW